MLTCRFDAVSLTANDMRMELMAYRKNRMAMTIEVALKNNVLIMKPAYAPATFKEGANKQVISSQADSLIKISRIWADFFPANTSNQPI